MKILSGEAAGREVTARRFPFTLGRSPEAGLQLVQRGVWEEHFRLERDPTHGLRVTAVGEATTRLNGHVIRESRLRNGDILEAGEARVQFWLGAVEQVSLRWRERLTWAGLAAFLVAQGLLVGFLPG
ncbi:MAG: FHA domain-containing protein [Verrucomicrobiales bacterium]|nr:FHA domain-containing protein [Verrucomicrobiales bacterium]